MSAVVKTGRVIGKVVKWFLAIAALLVAIIIVVAIVGLGKAANNADKQSTNVAAHVNQVQLGMTEAQVRSILGKPDSKQHMVSSGLVSDEWYYGTLSTKGSWQFAFDNGRLTAKNQY